MNVLNVVIIEYKGKVDWWT